MPSEETIHRERRPLLGGDYPGSAWWMEDRRFTPSRPRRSLQKRSCSCCPCAKRQVMLLVDSAPRCRESIPCPHRRSLATFHHQGVSA